MRTESEHFSSLPRVSEPESGRTLVCQILEIACTNTVSFSPLWWIQSIILQLHEKNEPDSVQDN